MLQWLIPGIWVTLSCFSMMVYIFPSVKALSLHGKLCSSNSIPNAFCVSKRWFAAFYLIGAIWNGFIMYIIEYDRDLGGWIVQMINVHPKLASILSMPLIQTPTPCLIMLQIHLVRRTIESSFITEFADSKMHAAALLLGLGHYFLLTLSIIVESPYLLSPSLSAMWLAWCLFAYASYHQYKCNIIQSMIKRLNQGYAIPNGDWFELLTSPLYTAEILIYMALFYASACTNTNLLFALLWVFTNQAISAEATHKWYSEKFRGEFPEKRWKLLPFIW